MSHELLVAPNEIMEEANYAQAMKFLEEPSDIPMAWDDSDEEYSEPLERGPDLDM